MKIWVVTTGNSDVALQLDSPATWNRWMRDVNEPPSIEIQPVQDNTSQLYSVPARYLGWVYQDFVKHNLADTIWPHFKFPLWSNFIGKLQDNGIDRIIVILTNQSAIFNHTDRNSHNPISPYWYDTCDLAGAFQRYLGEHFPQITPEFYRLVPHQGGHGLDHWDSVLQLVQEKIQEIVPTIDLNQVETIYVSHQAGTPAISSAVQFESLARFGDKVRFLVGNELQQDYTDEIRVSQYLRSLITQQAKSLLSQHNYAGVAVLVKDLLDERCRFYLNMAQLWGYTELDELSEDIQLNPYGDLQFNHSNLWCWKAYEEAYLASIMLTQKRSTDAMFHAFRAIEGLMKLWVEKYYGDCIAKEPNNESLFLKKEKIEFKPGFDNYWETQVVAFKPYMQSKPKMGLFGEALGYFVKDALPKTPAINTQPSEAQWNLLLDGPNALFKQRNQLFHGIEGITPLYLARIWAIDPQVAEEINSDQAAEKWRSSLLSILNALSDQDFKTLESASVMPQIHQLILEGIDRL